VGLFGKLPKAAIYQRFKAEKQHVGTALSKIAVQYRLAQNRASTEIA